MELRCVTRNLARRSSGQVWLDEIAAAGLADVLFLQEVPSGLTIPRSVQAFPDGLAAARGGQCRSLTLLKDSLQEHVLSASYLLPAQLDDYVLQMSLRLPDGNVAQLVNVHASPRPIDFDESPHAHWRRDAEKRIYYSDIISKKLCEMRKATGRVLAVGDFNEAMLWDDNHRTTSSAEFFTRLADCGLVDITGRDWAREVSTQTRHAYQVDRIFASSDLNVHVAAAGALGEDDGLSDHLPISFTMST